MLRVQEVSISAMIEIHFLEKLDAFARLGTLSAAAGELFISQPALTKSMEKLEEMCGVTLFKRSSNRLELTETGSYAAKLASQMLRENKTFVPRVQAYDRSLRTISLASCAPAPAYELTPRLQQLYPGMAIQAEVRSENGLLAGLDGDIYQLVVTHVRPTEDDLFVTGCGHETLSIAVPKGHPLAQRKQISFADLENVPIMQFREVGFWGELVSQLIPHPHILLQDSEAVFFEIRESSSLPTFHSDYYNESQAENIIHRKIIPISDKEATVAYYLVCKQENKDQFRLLFDHLPDWCRR